MKKKSMFYIFISILILVSIILYFFIEYKEDQIQNQTIKIYKKNDNTDLISQIISGQGLNSNNNYNSNNNAQTNQGSDFLNIGEKEDIISTNSNKTGKTITVYQNIDEKLNYKLDYFSGDYKEFRIEDLQKAYKDTVFKGDDKKGIEILEKMYKISKNESLQYLIIDKALKIYAFDTAMEHMKQVYKEGKGLEKGNINSYIYVLLNALLLDSTNIETIRTVIRTYYQKKLLTDNEKYYYNAILYLSELKIDAFKKELGYLQGNEFLNFQDDINNAFVEFNKYKEVPNYYLIGLLSFVMFQQGYFNVSERLAIESLKWSPDYILANQILAYSKFITNQWFKSTIYFKRLMQIDDSHQDIYKFFLGIAFFWNNNYEDTIVYLSQINNPEYQKDSYRYLILSYQQIKDSKNMIKYMTKLLELKPLSEDDYYTFFDIIFFQTWQDNKNNFEIVQENFDLIAKYMNQCYIDLSNAKVFICRYGKGGYYLTINAQDKALQYLLYLAQYYPRDYFFEKIALIYLQKNDLNNSKKYFIRAILYTDNQEKKEKFKKILLLIMNKKF